MASDGSSSDYSFSTNNTPTYNMDIATLQSEGWITTDNVLHIRKLTPEHDAAHVHWGGAWRMPTKQELDDLISKCDWATNTVNGILGYVVKGKGTYASASIFLPYAGCGYETSLPLAGSYGYFWSSIPDLRGTLYLRISSGDRRLDSRHRFVGESIRPVQGFTE